ncbi:MAG: hypothetical protein IJ861_02050 [Clostridia bacterium]|nr:hypothetical protein [Clostridia bacterium]
MIPTEFGIIDNFDPAKDYDDYEPEKYHCVAIDDDLYINDWWEKLQMMKTYFFRLDRPEFGLNRWGITLIPPESLPVLQDIIITDKRINEDEHLVALAQKVQQAIDEKKYMIHYGV